MVVVAHIAQTKSMNIQGIVKSVNFVVPKIMEVAVLIVQQRNIGMEAGETNVFGVSLQKTEAVVLIVQPKDMKNNWISLLDKCQKGVRSAVDSY